MPEEAGQGEQQRAGGEGDAGDGGHGWWVGASNPIRLGLFWFFKGSGGGQICPHPLKMGVMVGRFKN